MNTLMADLRSAIRALGAARSFTAIAVGTLGAGVALCAVVMTVLNAYVVRGLPYPAADRLYRIDYAAPGQPTPPNLEQLDWASLGDLVECHIAWDLDVFYMLGGEFPESAPGAWVTPGYMTGFGVRAALGRAFDNADFGAGSPPVALISDRLWRTRFLADPSVMGRSFQAFVSDRPDEPETFTVVGVLPADWWHLNNYTEVLAPLKAPTYPYMLRLRTGVSPTSVAEPIDALVRRGVTSLPSDFRVVMTSTHESYIAAVRPLLSSVTTAAALVLLIAGANVSVLLLVRGRLRQKELAVRLALGASHARVARLLALEGALIAAASTTLGVLASRATASRLGPLVEQFLERGVPGGLEALSMDTSVLLAASAGGVLVAMVFTVAPLAAILRPNLSRYLSSAGRATTDPPGAGRTRAALIGLEVAASLTLLTGAALMAETGLRMLRVNFGFDADPVVTASLALRERSFPDEASRAAFFDRLMTRLTGVGGSDTVALGDWWPLQGARPRRVATTGATPVVGTASPFAVTADYFTALGISLRDGRTFRREDRLGNEPVVVVSESLARRLWPQAGAVGELVTVYPNGEGPAVTAAGRGRRQRRTANARRQRLVRCVLAARAASRPLRLPVSQSAAIAVVGIRIACGRSERRSGNRGRSAATARGRPRTGTRATAFARLLAYSLCGLRMRARAGRDVRRHLVYRAPASARDCGAHRRRRRSKDDFDHVPSPGPAGADGRIGRRSRWKSRAGPVTAKSTVRRPRQRAARAVRGGVRLRRLRSCRHWVAGLARRLHRPRLPLEG